MTPSQRAILERLVESRRKVKLDWRGISFDKQISAIEDPHRLKCFFTTRRGAKSYTDGMYLIKEADETPGANCLYLGLTRLSAKGIIWKDVLKHIDDRQKLGIKFHETELTATLNNGSVIYVAGVDTNEDERKKLFGRKYKLVIIDEAALFGIDLRDLVYVVLRPALADLRGTLVLSGMASDITQGLFYDITTKAEPGWSLHEWTAHDNPHVAVQWAEELAFIAEHQPHLVGTARYKQAYLNQWAVDTEKLVYKFSEDRNLYDELPRYQSGEWTRVLSVDTGWEDDNAFVLSAYHTSDPNLYIEKTFNKPHMFFDHDDESVSVVKTIEKFLREQKIMRVVIDGANKQGVETMRSRSSIPFEYADKVAKNDFIEMFNGDLLRGRIKIHRSLTAYQTELKSLIWDTESGVVKLPRKEYPRLPNHLCDAGLYGWRNGYHYYFKEKVPPKPKTDQERAEELFKHQVERLERDRKQKDGQEYGSWQIDQTGAAPWNKWGE